MFDYFNQPKKPLFEGGFSELASEFKKHEFMSQIPEVTRKYSGISFIQFWLNVRDNPISFQFKPSEKLIQLVEDNMITVDYDRIYFEIIIFEDCFHLYAKYNQIIGSRYIGEFSLSELPKV